MVLRDVVLPTAKAHDLPFAMMIGVKRQINPSWVMRGTASAARICLAWSTSAARIRTKIPDDRAFA